MNRAAGLAIDELTEQVTDTPRVVVDRAIVAANVQRMQERATASGKTLRPHTKTHKMPEIARMQLEAGAVGIQVAKLGEAEVMADAGVADILVAYPIVGAEKLRRLAALADRVAVSVSLNSLEVAAGISRVAVEHGVRLGIVVEVDTGLHRIGVAPADAVDLAGRIADLPHLEFRGLLTHEGHVYTAAQDQAEMERLTREACQIVVDLAADARARGLAATIVSVGASGTARFDFGVSGVTEVRPGTYVFNDLTQLELGAAGEEDIAACVITTIVSRPAQDRAVVDAGTKTLSSDQRIVASPTRSFGQLARHGEIRRGARERGAWRPRPDPRRRSPHRRPSRDHPQPHLRRGQPP